MICKFWLQFLYTDLVYGEEGDECDEIFDANDVDDPVSDGSLRSNIVSCSQSSSSASFNNFST